MYRKRISVIKYETVAYLFGVLYHFFALQYHIIQIGKIDVASRTGLMAAAAIAICTLDFPQYAAAHISLFPCMSRASNSSYSSSSVFANPVALIPEYAVSSPGAVLYPRAPSGLPNW